MPHPGMWIKGAVLLLAPGPCPSPDVLWGVGAVPEQDAEQGLVPGQRHSAARGLLLVPKLDGLGEVQGQVLCRGRARRAMGSPCRVSTQRHSSVCVRCSPQCPGALLMGA